MSIMPAGGWDGPRDNSSVEPPGNTLGPSRHADLAVLALNENSNRRMFSGGFFGCLGVICAIVVAPIVFYVVTQMLTSTTGRASSQTSATAQTATHNAPDSRNDPSDEQSYSVSNIDANKNSIATGTALSVQGMFYTTKWGPTDDCTWLFARGHVNIQHGEADPSDYCRFSIVLTEKNKAGTDMWPSAGLLCDVTPVEMKMDMNQYHYGDSVRVHGTYAPSLDFAVAYVPGLHFGVPVLDNCTIDGLAASADRSR